MSASPPSLTSMQEQENLLARLDRLPVNRRILFLVFLLGIVWILEAFDIGIIAPVLFIIRNLWHLDPSTIGVVGSAGTLGIVLGLLPAGRIADHYGRKTTLLAGIVIFSIFTFAASFAQSVSVIIVCQFIAGLGQGAVFPVPYLLLSEFVNKRWRGAAVGYANSLLGFSYGLNTLAGALVIGNLAPETAWRVLLAIGGAPILMVPVILKFLPESPRFLLKVGKVETVRMFVEDLEKLSGVPHDEQLIDPAALKVLEYSATRKLTIFDLFPATLPSALRNRLYGALVTFRDFLCDHNLRPDDHPAHGRKPAERAILHVRASVPHCDYDCHCGQHRRQDQPPLGIGGDHDDHGPRHNRARHAVVNRRRGGRRSGRLGLRLCRISAGEALYGRAVSYATSRHGLDAGRKRHALPRRRRPRLPFSNS